MWVAGREAEAGVGDWGTGSGKIDSDRDIESERRKSFWAV